MHTDQMTLYRSHTEQSKPCAACMQNKYYAADAVAVDPMDKSITCVEEDGRTFDVKYDVLAIATGSQGRWLLHHISGLEAALHARSSELCGWHQESSLYV